MWYNKWEASGLIFWADLNADGKIQYTANNTEASLPRADANADLSATIAMNEMFIVDKVPVEVRKKIIEDRSAWATAQGGPAQARAQLLSLGAAHGPDKDIIVLATPEMAELMDWIIALMAAGGLAAALSTASGLLLVISSSIAHDLYYRLFAPEASEKQRLLVGRITIAGAVVVAGYFGIHPPGFVGEVVAFAFGLAAASFFPAIMLGIFSKRVGTVPAVTGMLVGLVFTAFYILTQKADTVLLSPDVAAAIFGTLDSPNALTFLRTPWCFGIDAQGIGTIGMLLNFIVTIVLTPMFPGPSAEVQAMIDQVREPEGIGPAVDIEAAVDH